ncbi:MAG: SDR family oxidoreductase [Desulfobacteraceae bacterium]|nr:MAG: SDR family oxidoreductase [Desulfobacteraceae bacterium]
MESSPVAVTGATGYVGGRLVPILLENGHRVRVLGRSIAKLKCRPWSNHPRLEIATSDVMDFESLFKGLEGCTAAYYLVHSMQPGEKNFEKADRRAAENMARAAARAGVKRIIYLGGLGEEAPSLSRHLRSRAEVAKILKDGEVPTTYLRAAVILGAGSASFEILRYLVERLPVMTTPRWVRTPCQPIAIRNVLNYLAGCLEKEETKGRTFDIGGPDILTYQDLMQIYAEEAGLPKRIIIPLPFLSPRLSSYWLHLVTPVPPSLARPLVEGLKSPVVCKENEIRNLIPQKLLTCREAVRIALDRVSQNRIETCWSDAGKSMAPEWVTCGDAQYAGGIILECCYRTVIRAPMEDLWRPIQEIGGKAGWYFADSLWKIRGILDRLAGGTGLRRGRRHPVEIRTGDALDFWRVLEVNPPSRILLHAEMRLPGDAVLEFRLTSMGYEETEILQISKFLPRGVLGLLYWYGLYPFHQFIFKGMLNAIAGKAERPIVKKPEKFIRSQNACRI